MNIVKMIKGGFVLLCIFIFIGVIIIHYSGVYESENGSEIDYSTQEQEHELSELESREKKITESMIIPMSKTPDYVGFSDIEFDIINGERQRSIKLFLKGCEAYVFLPSYTNLSEISIRIPEYIEAFIIDGRPIESGQALGEVQIDYPYTLSIIVCEDCKTDNNGIEEVDVANKINDTVNISSFDTYQLRFMKSENLPSLYIDTESGSMNQLNQDKRNWERGELVCLTKDGDVDSDGGIRRIHGRGTTSWGADQKSYTFYSALPINMLGMGGGTKWRIIGNAYDVTKERNALAYSLAKDLGLPNAVDYRYADVYFNGQYAGNYIICEGMEFSENQMNIDPQTDYLLQIVDKFAWDEEDVVFSTSNDMLWRIMNNSNRIIREEDALELRKKLDLIYQYTQNCSDDRVYAKLENIIDIDSFAKQFILNEMIDEADTNSNSMFYYITMSDGKLHAGPVWDCDRSMGSNMGKGRYYFYNSFVEGPSEWLMKNEVFRKEVEEILDDNRIAIENFRSNVDSFYEKITSSLNMTRILYGSAPDSWGTVWGIIDFGDADENERYLREYVDNRSRLIEAVIDSPDSYYEVLIHSKVYWLKKGDYISEDIVNQICEDSSFEYFAYPSGVKFDPQRLIQSNLVLKGVYPE